MTHVIFQSIPITLHQLRIEAIGALLSYLSLRFYFNYRFFLQKQPNLLTSKFHSHKITFKGTIFGFLGYWLLIATLLLFYSNTLLSALVFRLKEWIEQRKRLTR